MLKPRYLFLLIVLTCLTCLGQAQVRALAPGSYALPTTGMPPSDPFPPLLNFNASLTTQGSAPDHTVPVRRYQIIPAVILNAFLGRVALNNQLPALANALNLIADNIRIYADHAQVDCLAPITATNIVEAANLAAAMGNNWIRGNGTRNAPGFQAFLQYYGWLPGNLYIGPSTRGDTPTPEQLDSNALHVVGTKYMRILTDLHQLLTQYLASNSSTLLPHINDLLASIALQPAVFPLTASQWQLFNGQYMINTNLTPPARNSASEPQTAEAFFNTNCRELIPRLAQIKARFMELTAINSSTNPVDNLPYPF